jgi:hypothetical protein
MTHKYNGWSNRETWLVNVWFADDIHEPTTAETLELMVTDEIKEALEATGAMAGFLRDMMNTQAINWDELAEHIEDPERYAE